MRRAAIYLLTGLGSADVRAALADPDEGVRQAATQVLLKSRQVARTP